MNDPMASQVAFPVDPVAVTLASLQMTLQERERQLDVLRREVARYKRQSDEAQARAALVQAAMDRHLAHCSKDDGAIQRLIAELAEATARRKEQVAVIERRDRRIMALQQELEPFRRRRGLAGTVSRLKRFFSLRRA